MTRATLLTNKFARPTLCRAYIDLPKQDNGQPCGIRPFLFDFVQAITMKIRDRQLAGILTYSGTLPLVGCVVLLFAPIAGVDGKLVAIAYAAVILSFLCGIHWALFLFFSEKCPNNLLITSNMVALLAWASLLVTDHELALAFQGLCFLALFALDFKLRNAGVLPEWFYHLRRNATIIVVLCLACLAVLS